MNKRYYEHTLSTTREFIEYLLYVSAGNGAEPRIVRPEDGSGNSRMEQAVNARFYYLPSLAVINAR